MASPNTAVFEDTKCHRYTDQFDFLTRFPAYTVEHAGTHATLWHRVGPTACRLELVRQEQGVWVRGDLAVAARIFNRQAPRLLEAGRLPATPPVHRFLHRRYGGIRPVLFGDPFEGMAWTILGQQITVAFAAQMKRTLARRYGRPATEDPSSGLWVFPGTSVLAAVSVDDLRALQLSRQKARTLITVARAVEDGRLDLDGLYTLASDHAREVLTRFQGIGPWTAEYVLLRVFGHPDALPASDVGIQRAWARLMGVDGRSAEAAVREAGSAWEGSRSDFAFALWLDNLTVRAADRLQSNDRTT